MSRILAAPVILLALGCGPDYEISDYRVEIDASSATLIMHVEYDLRSGSKRGGFKYIGNLSARNIFSTDETGRAVAARVVNERETKLEWDLPNLRAGRRGAVQLSFRADGLINRVGSRHTIDAPWMGVFRVPVRYAKWVVRLPATATNLHISPGAVTTRDNIGRILVTIEQAPLELKALRVTWQTNNAANDEKMEQPYHARQEAPPENNPFLDWFHTILMFIIIPFLTFIIAIINRRMNNGGTGECGDVHHGGGCGCGG